MRMSYTTPPQTHTCYRLLAAGAQGAAQQMIMGLAIRLSVEFEKATVSERGEALLQKVGRFVMRRWPWRVWRTYLTLPVP